jgi:hypothetical protein
LQLFTFNDPKRINKTFVFLWQDLYIKLFCLKEISAVPVNLTDADYVVNPEEDFVVVALI